MQVTNRVECRGGGCFSGVPTSPYRSPRALPCPQALPALTGQVPCPVPGPTSQVPSPGMVDGGVPVLACRLMVMSPCRF